MKLEVVDKRSPALIRVASVQEVDTHRIKVSAGLNAGLGYRVKPLGLTLHRTHPSPERRNESR